VTTKPGAIMCHVLVCSPTTIHAETPQTRSRGHGPSTHPAGSPHRSQQSKHPAPRHAWTSLARPAQRTRHSTDPSRDMAAGRHIYIRDYVKHITLRRCCVHTHPTHTPSHHKLSPRYGQPPLLAQHPRAPCFKFFFSSRAVASTRSS
jgi:hypothetical protein